MAYRKKEVAADLTTRFEPSVDNTSFETQDLNKKFLYSEYLFFIIICILFLASLFHVIDPFKVKKLAFITWGSFLIAKISLLKKETLMSFMSKINLCIQKWEEKEVEKMVQVEKEKK